MTSNHHTELKTLAEKLTKDRKDEVKKGMSNNMCDQKKFFK